jgi:hypothetical protein
MIGVGATILCQQQKSVILCWDRTKGQKMGVLFLLYKNVLKEREEREKPPKMTTFLRKNTSF